MKCGICTTFFFFFLIGRCVHPCFLGLPASGGERKRPRRISAPSARLVCARAFPGTIQVASMRPDGRCLFSNSTNAPRCPFALDFCLTRKHCPYELQSSGRFSVNRKAPRCVDEMREPTPLDVLVCKYQQIARVTTSGFLTRASRVSDSPSSFSHINICWQGASILF